MPNTGKPSPNCDLCRRRRVKCDLTRPACTRCVKYGAACPGYRDDLDLLFHNQSIGTLEKQVAVRRGINARQTEDHSDLTFASSSSPSQEDQLSSYLAFTPVTSGSDTPALLFESSPGLQITRRSVSSILGCFSLSTDVSPTIDNLGFLPSIYAEADEASSLFVATDTIAKAYMANQTNSSLDPDEISELYGRGLKAIHEDLQKGPNSVKDETILAVWVLMKYEIVTGSPQTTNRPGPDAWHAHVDGLVGLLSLRGPEQFTSKRGRDIFWTVFAHILLRAIMANVTCPAESHDWITLFVASVDSQADSYERLITLVSLYIIDACSLVCTLLSKICAGPVSAADYVTLQAALDAVENIVPEDIYLAHSASIGQTYLWNLYRAARIKVHHLFVLLTNSAKARAVEGPHDKSDIADPIFELLAHRRRQSLATLRAMAQDILFTVPPSIMACSTPSPSLRCHSASGQMVPEFMQPVCLTELLQLVWPLGVVQTVPSVLPEQRQVAREVNYAIGTYWGIREAIKERPKARYVPPEAAWKEEELEVDDIAWFTE